MLPIDNLDDPNDLCTNQNFTIQEKIDHLIMHQEESLIEIQRVQIDMMNDIIERVKK